MKPYDPLKDPEKLEQLRWLEEQRAAGNKQPIWLPPTRWWESEYLRRIATSWRGMMDYCCEVKHRLRPGEFDKLKRAIRLFRRKNAARERIKQREEHSA